MPDPNTHQRRFLTPLPDLMAKSLQRLLQALQRGHGELQPPPTDTFAVQLQGLGLALVFNAGDEGRIRVAARPVSDAATTLAATPVTLLLQAGGRQGGNGMRIEGDVTVAQAWQRWFGALFQSPLEDPEALLSEPLGPVVGVQLAGLLRALRHWAGSARDHALDSIGEYLREESGLLVTRDEMNRFLDDVDALRERIERLGAMVRE